MRHIVRAAFVTIVLLAAPAAARAELVEEIIAWVNGEIITFSDYEREKESAIAEAYRSLQGRELDEWLTDVGAGTAVISVGSNDYGHPSQAVVDLLEDSGAIVLRTDRDGDIVIPLDRW